MKNNFVVTAALLTVITGSQASADQIISENLIVTTPDIPDAAITGSICVGFDCANNEVFGGATLKLKENNNRIRFVDNTAGAILGQSWMMIANGSNNGGFSYFQFQARSLTEDTITLSDGSYPILDCSASVMFGDCITTGFIPVGDPALVQDNSNLTSLITTPFFTVRSVLFLGVASDNSVALGGDSEVVSGAVSVGKAGLERKLLHVAKALAATDIATIADIEALTDKLDLIDSQLNEIERAIAVVDGTSLFNSNGSLAPYSLLVIVSIFLLRIMRRSPGGVCQ